MKMNLSMDFIKPVSGTLKKYKAMVPSVIITVIALLLLLPTMMVGGNIKEKVDKSVQTARAVQSVNKDVPSKDQVPLIKQVIGKLEEEATEIKTLAKQSSQRDLITYKHLIFPKPEDQSIQIYEIFGTEYRRAIEGLIEKLNALDAPSDREIAQAGGTIKQTAVGVHRGDINAQDPMIDALCQSRAQEISVYANPSAFNWYGFWKEYEFTGQNQALEDCWDSQVAFWIYEDVVDTVIKMNGVTDNVLETPVKRLLGVSFNGPVMTETSNRNQSYQAMGSGEQDIPNYVAPLLVSNFLNASPTGRKCDDKIDVIHFAVSVILKNRSVLPFMKELCSEKPHTFYPSVFEEPFLKNGEPEQSQHNQIAILQSDLQAISKNDPDHELYRYGTGAVMRLDLICEYQFDRSGYDNIKPDTIKKRLDQLEEGAEEESGSSRGRSKKGQRPNDFMM